MHAPLLFCLFSIGYAVILDTHRQKPNLFIVLVSITHDQLPRLPHHHLRASVRQSPYRRPLPSALCQHPLIHRHRLTRRSLPDRPRAGQALLPQRSGQRRLGQRQAHGVHDLVTVVRSGARLQVLGVSSVLGDLCEHTRTDLLTIMKRKHIIRPA